MTNRQPSSASAKPQKLFLFPGDPLIKTLKPDYYVIVDPYSLEQVVVSDGEGGEGGEVVDPPPLPNEFEPPNLEDITLVSKKLVTDKNKNQYIFHNLNLQTFHTLTKDDIILMN